MIAQTTNYLSQKFQNTTILVKDFTLFSANWVIEKAKEQAKKHGPTVAVAATLFGAGAYFAYSHFNKKYQNRISHLESEVSEKTQDTARYKQQITTLALATKTLAGKAADSEKQIIKLTADLTSSKDQLGRAKEKSSIFESVISQREASIKTCHDKIRDLTGLLQLSKEKLAAQSNTITSIKAGHEVHISNLYQEINSLKANRGYPQETLESNSPREDSWVSSIARAFTNQ